MAGCHHENHLGPYVIFLSRSLAMPPYKIKYASNLDRELWDEYVRDHPDASLFHMFGWRDVFHRTYGHTTYYLMACNEEMDAASRIAEGRRHSAERVLGVLPVVHFKHTIFGNWLVSSPFVDGGGMLY